LVIDPPLAGSIGVPSARNRQTNAVRGNAAFAAASHCKRGEDDGGEEDRNQAHLLVYESGAAPGPAESQAFAGTMILG